MNILSRKMRPIVMLGLAIPTIAGFATLASAHSNGSCVDAVVQSCNAQYPNNYQARLACTNSGITQCANHKHGGGGRPKGAGDSYSSGGSGDASPAKRFQKRQMR